MHVWSPNLLILARMQLKRRKGKLLIVEQLFGLQIVYLNHTVCVREEKKEEKQQQN